MSDLKLKLGKRIKELRKSAGITQEKLAEMISMDITSLSKIETGSNYPQPDTIEKIAGILNIEVYKLFMFNSLSSQEDYLLGIQNNLNMIKNNEEKLRILHGISSFLV